MTDKEWEDLDASVLNSIWLCLVDDVLFNIIRSNHNRLMEQDGDVWEHNNI